MSLSLPSVCIGLPVYNGAAYLRRGIESLLAQHHRNLRLCISDNASTDETEAICRHYATLDRRVNYTRLNANVGMLANFRRVASEARGSDYFMWAACDDVWQPDFVTALLGDLEAHREAGLAMCAVGLHDELGSNIGTIRFSGPDDPGAMGSYARLRAVTNFGKKYNIFIYGLFRSEVISRAAKYFKDACLPDRGFMTHVALATPWRYVDRVLYSRTKYKLDVHQRYPEELAARLWRRGSLARLGSILSLGKTLLKSDIIPARRKLCIPVAMWRLLRMLAK